MNTAAEIEDNNGRQTGDIDLKYLIEEKAIFAVIFLLNAKLFSNLSTKLNPKMKALLFKIFMINQACLNAQAKV